MSGLHYATLDELAQLYGWTSGYILKLASLHQWRRRGHHPRQYCLEDVTATRASMARPPRIRTVR